MDASQILKSYPPDLKKDFHIGQLKRLVWSNPEGTYHIIELTDERTVTLNGDIEQLESGTIYRFHGRWDVPANSLRYGPKFVADTFTIEGFRGRVGLTRYLVNTCDGIGQKIADHLYCKYAGETVRVLRDDPETVARENDISLELCRAASRQLINDSYCQTTKIELIELFNRRGFRGTLIDECLKKWGKHAGEQIRKNPFALLGMPSASFKRCDKLWADIGLSLKAIRRQYEAVVYLANSERSGNTWVLASVLAEKLKEMIPQSNPMRAFRLAIRARRIKVRHEVNAAGEKTTYIASYTRAVAEEQIAAAICRLGKCANQWPIEAVTPTQVEGDKLPSQHQVDELRKPVAGCVGVFCGGPGTGKTHTLAYLLKAVIEQFGRQSVAVCAPTGKAAVRAQQSLASAGIQIETTTIHRLLEIGRNDHDGEGWGFVRCASNPLPYRFLVVDETSMVDAELMASLLVACSPGTHVLFIGDPYQLPPVGHGSPLRDFLASGAVPAGELTEVRRNAGQIVHACRAVKENKDFATCTRFELEAVPPLNLRIVHSSRPKDTAEVIEQILQSSKRFHPIWQSQVIVARNKGSEIGRKELNDRLQMILNPEGRSVNGIPFRVGDKIICTRNGRLSVAIFDESTTDTQDARSYFPEMVPNPDTGKPEPIQQYVANGEIGRVIAVAGGCMIARFSESEQLVKIPVGKQSSEGDESDESQAGRGCNFDLAYAVTCHKMQGSEAPLVIVAIDPAGHMIATREWIYTALSRASKACIIVGDKDTLDRQRQKQALHLRKTFLVESLKANQSE